MKGKVYKCPVSILVVVYVQDTKRVLMLQRYDDPDFRQSITDSVKEGGTASQAAMREVEKEATIDAVAGRLTLIDCRRTVGFETSSNLRHRCASGVTRNMESWSCLTLPHE